MDNNVQDDLFDLQDYLILKKTQSRPQICAI